MAYTRTFAQLSTAVQTEGQWENSADITASVLLQAINHGLLKGYDVMTQKWADYYTTSADFAIVAGTSSYVLETIAPNFYKLRNLDVSEDGVRFVRCYPHDLEVAHRYTTRPATSVRRLRYRMQAGNLVFVPVPPAGTGRIFFIPLPVQFASTVDATPVKFDVPAEELLVIHHAQRMILLRSDLDTVSIDRMIIEDTAGLRTAADARDAGQPFYLDPNGPPRERWGFVDDEGDFY